MKKLISKNPLRTSWVDDIIGQDDSNCRKTFEFCMYKKWIDSIMDELEKNLMLFFLVYTGVQNLKDVRQRNRLMVEIEQVILGEPDELICLLKKFQSTYKIKHCEIPEKHLVILNAVKNLNQQLPIEEEVLLPYKKEITEEEKFQWIPRILVNETKIYYLNKNIMLLEKAFEKTKLEQFTLNGRSAREIKELLRQSELHLHDMKQTGERKFDALQQETSKKVLNLSEHKEYQELLVENNRKRRELTKAIVQLQHWIKQYDQFVGEPMKELEALESEVDQFAEWKHTIYDPQDERFQQLKFNVDMLEAELIEEQIERFRIEHAVRVLQRAWRKVLEKRKSKRNRKKKKAKGTGKKKHGKKKK